MSVGDKEQTSLLLGNGILLCHSPNDETLRFKFSKIKEGLINIYEEYYQGFDVDCPEDLLDRIRIEVSFEILKWYTTQFNLNLIPGELDNLRFYVQQFRNIFTTNYDPITYKSIFSSFQGSGGANFCDGFTRMDGDLVELSIDKIKDNLKEQYKGIYYLHGAFHLIYHYIPEKPDSKDFYEKIKAVRSEGKDLIKTIEERHKEIVDNWRHKKIDRKKGYVDSFCVLESRSIYKEAWIRDDPYLDFCRKRLRKQRKILTLGCSFKKDKHILEEILLNENLERLQIGIYSDQDKKNICQAYREIEKSHANQCEYKQDILKRNLENTSFICAKMLGKVLWKNPS